MKQKKIKNERIRSRLYWNKKKTAVAGKSGETPLIFREHPNWLNPNFPDIDYLITYSSDMKLRFISPYTGMFSAKFKEFSAKKDEIPRPKPATDNFGNDVSFFFALCRMVDTRFNGMNFSIRLDYEKVAKDDQGEAFIVGESKPANLLMGLLEGAGVANQEWTYSENLLPLWEKAMQNNQLEFNVLFEKGWPTRIFPTDEFKEASEEEDPFDEEETDYFDEMNAFDSEE